MKWGLLVGCLTPQQHASVSQERIWSEKFTHCYTETEAADQTFYLTQSQYTDAGPTSPSDDPITPEPGRAATGMPIFFFFFFFKTVTSMTRPGKTSPRRKRESNRRSSALKAGALTTWPTRRWERGDRSPACFPLCRRTTCRWATEMSTDGSENTRKAL